MSGSTLDLFSLVGKVAVVTGGTSGIGSMMTKGLLDAGARVYVSSRKVDACVRVVDELSVYGEIAAVPADLARPEECRRLAAEMAEREERVHVLVNNAGTTWSASFEEFPESGWDKVMDLNLKAPFFLTQAFLPLLEAAAVPDDPARVVNVGSIDGMRVNGLPTYPYSVSKIGLHHLTAILARELGPRGIAVNAVAPGAFHSRMTATFLETRAARLATKCPLGRLGRAEDMAGVVVYLASRAASYVAGAVIPVDGGSRTTG